MVIILNDPYSYMSSLHMNDRMYEMDGEEIFVIDGHVHLWDARPENIIHEGGEQFISTSEVQQVIEAENRMVLP